MTADCIKRGDGALPQQPVALQQIADHLRVMLASATELHDGIGDVTGYKIKTGALHRILGVLSGAGHPVSIPSVPNKSVSLPDGRVTVAYVTTTDAGWAQLWVHGMILRSAYGQRGKEELDAVAAKVNASAGLQSPPVSLPQQEGEARDAAEILREHREWASMFGEALILALQKDYSKVDELAKTMPIEFLDGPTLYSALLKEKGTPHA